MQQLVQSAAKDPSGGATAGLKATLQEYLNDFIRVKGKVVTTANDPASGTVKDLEIGLSKLNQLLIEGSPSRRAIEAVFGTGSKEMQDLDLIRKQVEIIGRRYRSAAGGSPTPVQQAIERSTEEAIANNTLGALHRLASNGRERMRSGGFMGWLGDAAQRFWTGDVKERATKVLEDTIQDPNKLRLAMLSPTPENAPAIRSFLKPYGIPYSFDPYSTKKETIGNSEVLTDDTGLRLIQSNGKFKIFGPSGNVIGIVDSREKAQKVADAYSKKMLQYKKN